MKKLKIIFVCFFLACLISGCKSGAAESGASNQAGIPKNTVPHSERSESSLSDVQDTLPAQEDIPQISDDPAGEQSSEASSETEPGEDSTPSQESEYRAFEYLDLLNSDCVHASMTEAISFDSENVVGQEKEYFINGKNKVYVNDYKRVVMDDREAVVMNFDDMTYYKYEVEPIEGEHYEFGYGVQNYTPESCDISSDGTVTEKYTVSTRGETIVSTWTFFTDGTITVSDLNPESGSYHWYNFHVIETDTSGMDMSIPEYLSPAEPEEIVY